MQIMFSCSDMCPPRITVDAYDIVAVKDAEEPRTSRIYLRDGTWYKVNTAPEKILEELAKLEELEHEINAI